MSDQTDSFYKNLTRSDFIKNLLIFLFVILLSNFSFAVGPSLTYHGRILKPDGTPVTSNSVQFRVQVKSPGAENCLLYEETQTLDLSTTDGVFVLNLNSGAGTRTDSSGYSVAQVFSNKNTFTLPGGTCASGTTYAPSATDARKLNVLFDDGTGLDVMPTQTISFAPTSINSLQVGGYTPSSLLRVEDAGVLGTVAPLTSAYFTELMNLITGTTTQYMKQGASGGAALPVYAGNPASPAAGSTWFDSNANVMKFYDGTSVRTIGTSGGSVTSVIAGNGLSGGTITTSGTISLPNVGTAGTYTQVTTDAYGRVTAGTSPTTLSGYGITDAVQNLGNTPGIQTGADASKPASPAVGTLYFASDTRKTYQFIAGSWSQIGDGNTVSSQWTTNGSDIYRSSGNVGIGTTTPTAKLHLNDSVNGNTQLLINNNAGTPTSFKLETGNGYHTLGTLTAHPLVFATSGAEAMRLDSTGKLGIGTVAPAYKLDVVGDINVTGNFKINGSNIASGTVTTVSGTAPISVTNGSSTPVISIATANTTTTGALSSTDWNTFNNKLGTTSTFTGDVSGTSSTMSVDKLKGTPLSMTSITAGNFLKFDGTNWINATPAITDITGLSTQLADKVTYTQMPSNCSSNQTLNFIAPTGNWSCVTITGLDAAAITTGTIANARLPASATYWQSATGGINYAGGNVGIGTTTPTSVLQLKAGTATAGTSPLKFTSGANLTTPEAGAVEYDGTNLYYTDGTATRKTLATVGGTGNISGLTAGRVPFAGSATSLTDSANLFWDSTNSRLGIGTATPSFPLSVNGNTYLEGAVGIGTGSSSSFGGVGANLVIKDTGSNTGINIISNQGTTIMRSGTEGFSIRTNMSPLILGAGNTSGNGQMALTSSGNVGIGTTTPGDKLHVVGNALIQGSDGWDGAGDIAGLWFGSNASQRLGFGYKYGGGFAIDVYKSGSTGYLGGPNALNALTLLDTSGNVGIGTTTPTAALQLKAGMATAGTSPLKFTAGTNLTTPEAGAVEYDGTNLYYTDGTASRKTLATVGGTGNISGLTAGRVPFAGSATSLTDSANLFWDSSNSRLGIGTSTPTTNLQVGSNLFVNSTNTFGGTAVNNPYVVVGPYASTLGGDQAAAFNITNNDSSGFALFRFGTISPASGAVGEFGGAGSSAPLFANTVFFNTKGSYPLVYAVNNSEKMRINTSGNVGIGTTAPSATLHVQGATTAGGYLQALNLNNTAYNNTGPGGVDLNFMNDFSGNNNVGAKLRMIRMGSYNQADLAFFTNNTASVGDVSTEKMRISSSGNVGIGTTSPTAALQLKAGTATAGTSPLKFTSGVNLTTPEAGAVEYDGTNLYFTDSGATRRTLATTSGGGQISGLTAGRVPFAGSATSLTDSANLFWDSSNSRLGIGTTTPNAFMDILGTTEQLRLRNSAGVYTSFNVDSSGALNLTQTGSLANASLLKIGSATTIDSNGRLYLGEVAGTYSTLDAGIAATGRAGATVPAIVARSNAASNGSNSIPLQSWQNTSGTNLAVITNAGNLGIGNLTPTAALQLKAGTATAGTSPLKFTSGTNLTTPEAGAVEYDGTNLYFTDSGATRRTIATTSGGGQISGLTAGRIPFAGSATSLTDSANLFWDSGNSRLGLGTASPSYPLHILSSGTNSTNMYVTDQSTGYMSFSNANFGGSTSGSPRLIMGTGASSGANAGSYASLYGKLEAWVDVVATNNTAGQRWMRFGNGQPANTFSIQSLNDAGNSITATPFSIVNSAPTGSFYINGSGQVGIGTTAPTSPLTFPANSQIQWGANSYLSGNGAGYFKLGWGSGGTDGVLQVNTLSEIRAVGGGFASGTNAVGSSLVIGSQASTGNASGGPIIFQNSNAGTSGSSSNSPTEKMRIDASGNVGIGTTSPTAALQLKAGTATAGTSPLKFTSGVNLTTPEAGAVEYDGTNLYFTDSGATRRTLATTSGGGQISGLTAGRIPFAGSATSLTDSANLFWDSTNSRLGIGTATPSAKIDLYNSGSTSTNPGMIIRDNVTPSLQSIADSLLTVRGTGASTTFWRGRITAGGDNASFLMGEYNSQAWLGAHNAALNAWTDLRISPDGNSQKTYIGVNGGMNNPALVVQNSNGNVGIGVASPNRALNVQGTGGFLPTSGTSTIGAVSLTVGNNAHMFFGLNNANPWQGWIQMAEPGNMSATWPLLLNPNGGNVGIGVTTPSATLQLKAGTATASTAPLKFTSGTNLTTPEAGAVEYDGTNLYFTDGTATRRTLATTSGGGQISGLTAGRIPFAGSATSLTDSANLFWDSTNSRMGIGTTTPSYPLEISGTGAQSINVQSSGSNTSSIRLGNANNGTAILGLAGTVFQATHSDGTQFITATRGGSMYLNTHSNGVNIGNVGIGLTSPTSLFHTSDTAAKTANYTGVVHSVTNTSSTASVNKVGMEIQSTGTWNGTSAVNTGLVVNATGGTTNYAATFSGGNVGIGTTTPTALLEIVGSNVAMNSGGMLKIKQTDIGGADKGSAIGFYNNIDTTAANSNANLAAEIGARKESNTNTNSRSYLYFTTAGAGGPERMRIDSNGNVGIGTTAPTGKLSVSGTGAVFAGVGAATSGQYMTLDNTGANGVFGIESSTGGGLYTGTLPYSTVIGNGGSRALHLIQGAAIRATFDTSGNLGIGTTSPTAVLQLKAGTATASTAPLKFTSGTNLTTPEAGAVEYDGTNLYFTDGTATRRTLATTSSGGQISGLTAGRIPFAGSATSLTDSANLFWDSANSRLGIGTVSPLRNFHLLGTSMFDRSGANVTTISKGGANDFVFIPSSSSNGITVSNQSGGSTSGQAYTDVIPNSIAFNGGGGGNSSSIANGSAALTLSNDHSSGTIRFNVNASEKMIVLSSGNVGIGTSSPSNTLSIAGTNTGLRIDNADNGLGQGANGIQMITTTANKGVGVSMSNALMTSTNGWQFFAKGGITDFVIGRASLRDNIILGGSQASAFFPGPNGGSSLASGNYTVMASAGTDPTFVPFIARGNASQTANLQEWQNSAGTALTVVDKNGFVGIGNTSPTAALHLKAGTATASTAPLKFTSGTNLTTPEAGAVEYDGTNLYFTDGTATRKTIATTSNSGNVTANSYTATYNGGFTAWGNGNGMYSATFNSLASVGDALITSNTNVLRLGSSGTGTLYAGQVGIGTTTPSELLEVNGNVKAGSYLYTSDARLKKDFEKIVNPLADLFRLRGTKFTWKSNGKKDIGFLAQDIEKVYPELVATDPRSGLKSVEYGNISAILVEALKQEVTERRASQEICEQRLKGVERQVASETQVTRQEFKKLQDENKDLKSRLQRLEEMMLKGQKK